MSILSSVVDEILKLQGAPAYALVGGLAFAEAALFVGFVLPGETAVLLGGVLANQHRVSLVGIAAVAVLAAIVGDSIGYEVGRHFGPRLLGSRLFARRQKGIERGKQALLANGGRAVFLARFTAFLRAVMPGLAGTVRMPYLRFLAFNAAGGLIWATGFTILGYLAGASYHTIENYAGKASEIILAIIVIAVLAVVIIRRRRERDPAPAASPPPPASSKPAPPANHDSAPRSPAPSPLPPAGGSSANEAGRQSEMAAGPGGADGADGAEEADGPGGTEEADGTDGPTPAAAGESAPARAPTVSPAPVPEPPHPVTHPITGSDTYCDHSTYPNDKRPT